MIGGPRGSTRRSVMLLSLTAGLGGVLAYARPRWDLGARQKEAMEPPLLATARTRLGLNLFGLAPYNRQQVFANLISQSEWFVSHGQGRAWTLMPADQLDRNGWVRFLKPGQTAPRPLVLPPAPFRPTQVHCSFEGRGELAAGGVASVVDRQAQRLLLSLDPSGVPDEGAWIELLRTDPADPIRNIDCRETMLPREARFHPEFLGFLQGFAVLRFVDWQRINDNAPARWAERTRPESSSQAGAGGASIEDMVELSNRVGADPWFLMPYRADADYIRNFARLVHQRIDPRSTVYVEFGNEVWNSIFDAARQAQEEGLALELGDGDPGRAQALRYAQKVREAMRIWTGEFADRPGRLVRVAASQHANPDHASVILGDADTIAWVDALATAPYIWIDLEGRGIADTDWVFARMPGAIEHTMDFAARNRAIAFSHGKRFIAYEGGQHLVTPDLALARAVQRDPRMGDAYRRYLDRWDARIRSDLTLYASTAPISEYGSWGLREYAGQPIGEAPKLAAVRDYLKRHG